MKYRSDNTKYPDPTNIFEAILLWWRNLWDKEYQESKSRYHRLHSYDNLRMSKSEKAAQFKAMKKAAMEAKKNGVSGLKQK